VLLLEHEDRALFIRHPHSMRRPTDRAATTYPRPRQALRGYRARQASAARDNQAGPGMAHGRVTASTAEQ
jgi:hypothetical protein